MSTAALLAQAAIRDRVMPLSVTQYRQLCRIDPRLWKTELIEGLIVSKVTKSPVLVQFDYSTTH